MMAFSGAIGTLAAIYMISGIVNHHLAVWSFSILSLIGSAVFYYLMVEMIKCKNIEIEIEMESNNS